jgi:predicted nuclease of restriction endonuclease-like (RecB) superfamily
MAKKITKIENNYDSILTNVVELLEQARRLSARSVNAIMTATYWEIGRQIIEVEQKGEERAEYGASLLKKLAGDLTDRYGRGFSRQNLQQMRLFYLGWQTCQTASGKSEIVQIVSGLSSSAKEIDFVKTDYLFKIAKNFPLPWSHYVLLLSCKNENARRFYEDESLRGGWTVRQLKRQMNSKFYERTALSKDKVSMLKKGAKPLPEDYVSPEEEIKDSFVLEFLGLKDEYSEHELEEAIIEHLEKFLLELGAGFAFVGRQMRLRIGDEWYRVDLVLFNRRLRCLVIIDLKLGKLTHADIGQMLLYSGYADEHWRMEGENPPIGLILCDQNNTALAHYTLENLPNKILASEYQMILPSEEILIEEINKAKRRIGK